MRSELVCELHSTRGQSIAVPEHTGSPREGYWWLLGPGQWEPPGMCSLCEGQCASPHSYPAAEMPAMFISCQGLEVFVDCKVVTFIK